MKTKQFIRSLFKSCLALLMTGTAVAQCNAVIYPIPTSTCSAITFSAGNFNGLYSWDFGDGSTATYTSNTGFDHYYYPSNNTYYTVTLNLYTITNTVTPCSTTTQTVGLLCPYSYTCQAAFNTVTNPDCHQYQFVNNSTLPNTSCYYVWDFGDGNTNTVFSNNAVNYTYTTSGVYAVSLSIYTSTANPVPCSTATQTLSACVTTTTTTTTCLSGYSVSTGNSSASCNERYFINQSTGGTYYEWQFGDGYLTSTFSTAPIHHTYATSNNTYTTTLSVYTTSAATTPCSVSQQTISVNCGTLTPCIAGFTAAGNYTANCNTFEFVNTSSVTAGPSAYYKWEYGDGAVYNAYSNANVYHTYTISGIYTPTLSVYSSTATSVPCSSITNTLAVNCGTTALCQSVYNVNTASGSNCNQAYFYTTSTGGNYYVYDFGDGYTAAVTTSTAQHTYATGNNTYTTSLSVYTNSTSPTACSISYQLVSVNCGTATTCNAVFNAVGNYTSSCNTFAFVNNSSSPGPSAFYKWEFGDGNSTNTFSAGNVYHQYLTNGVYTPTLSIYSSTASATPCSSITHTLSVNCGTAAVCQSVYTANASNPCNYAYFTSFSSGPISYYVWDFGDGTTATVHSNTLTSVLSNTIQHTYATGPQTYTTSLSLYNSPTATAPCDISYQLLSVNCGTPTCLANSQFALFADTANAGNYFAYNSSTGTGTLSYVWNFGDGTTSTQQYPFHQYATPGHYIICLQVTGTSSGAHCTDTYCDSSSVQRMAAGFLMGSLTVIPQTATGIKSMDVIRTFAAYPNPVSDELTIEVELNSPATKVNYELVNALGQTILKNTITDPKTVINTYNLNNGFYFLFMKDESGKIIKSVKVVK